MPKGQSCKGKCGPAQIGQIPGSHYDPDEGRNDYDRVHAYHSTKNPADPCKCTCWIVFKKYKMVKDEAGVLVPEYQEEKSFIDYEITVGRQKSDFPSKKESKDVEKDGYWDISTECAQ